MKVLCVIICCCFAISSVAFISFLGTKSSFADYPAVWPRNSTLDGKSLETHAVDWWLYFLNNSKTRNPASDQDGSNCHIAETDVVWYAYGNLGGETTRNCNISSEKSIFGAVISSECSIPFEYPKLKTKEDVALCIKKGMDDVSSFSVQLDGTPLKNSDIYRMATKMFKVAFPSSDNVYGLAIPPGGISDALAEGYFFALKPLERGPHKLVISATILPGPETGGNSWATKSTYNLIIE